MGKALIKSDMGQVIGLIKRWAKDHNLTLAESHSTNADAQDSLKEHVEIGGKSKFYKVVWLCQAGSGDTAVNMILKLRSYISCIFYAVLFLALLFLIRSSQRIFVRYENRELLLLLIVFLILWIWWKCDCFFLKLTRTEKSFWDMVGQTNDMLQFTRFQSHTDDHKFKLFVLFLMIFIIIYLHLLVFGILWGFVVFAIDIPLSMIFVVEVLHNHKPQWNWRFWIISNMVGWNFLMTSVLLIFLFLSAVEFTHTVEFIHTIKLYESKGNNIVLQIFQMDKFRKITPATATFLESDCKKTLYRLANYKYTHLKESISPVSQETRLQLVENKIQFHCKLLLTIMIVAVCVFSLESLRLLLKKQNTWKYQVNRQMDAQGTFIPYLPQAWKWETPKTLRILIFFHWILGGIVNVAVTLLCIDSLSYMIVGHTLFLGKIANLWSWVFAFSEIIFGATGGQVIGGIFVIATIFPTLLLLITYIRRCVLMSRFTLRVLHAYLDCTSVESNALGYIKNYTQQVCLKYQISMPIILLTQRRNIIVDVHWLPLIGKSIIELSQNTLDLLSPHELEAAITHEIGHIRQGLWKVSALKFLSSLALFPNYYLTLCMDWAKKEIEADRFALEVTKDVQSLKQALIKISTAQIPYSISSENSVGDERKLLTKIATKLKNGFVSMSFFFGDGLFGYAHPYLSERLVAIDSHKM